MCADEYDRNADSSFVEDAAARLAYRMPHLADAAASASWAGLYTITPDWSMIVDRAPEVEGMYLAVGGSGHSFKLAPAIGQCLAEMIVDWSVVLSGHIRAARNPLRRGRAASLDVWGKPRVERVGLYAPRAIRCPAQPLDMPLFTASSTP